MSALTVLQEEIIDIQLPAAIIELHRFVSKDELRVALTHVQVTASEHNILRGVATCGHMLARVDVIGTGACFHGPVYIAGDALKSIKAKKGEAVTMRLEENVQRFGVGPSVISVNAPEEIKFPDWEQVFPQLGKERATGWGIDTRLVARVFDYLKKAGLKTMVKVNAPNDDLSPMTITSDDGEVSTTFVIMPCRI